MKRRPLPPRMLRVHCSACGGRGFTFSINGFWLRAQRLRSGISQKEMADRLGLWQERLCKIERGRTTATQDIAARIILETGRKR